MTDPGRTSAHASAGTSARSTVTRFRRPAQGSDHPRPRGQSSLSSPSSAFPPIGSPGSYPAGPAPTDQFAPDFDVLHELTIDRDRWAGEEELTVYSLPNYMRADLDILRSRVPANTQPSLPTTLACCASYGIQIISENVDVGALIRLKRQLNSANNIDGDDLVELYHWFWTFTVSLADASGSGSRRINFHRFSGSVKQAAGVLAEELGIASWLVVVLGAMITLADQTSTPTVHTKYMEQAVTTFYRRAARRRRLAELILAEAL